MLPIPLAVPDIDKHLCDLDLGISHLKIVNMEMEASLLHRLGYGCGVPTGTICSPLAHRPTDTFHRDPDAIHLCSRIALHALAKL